MKKIILYTDGACSGNPGPGGWAYAAVENNEISYSQSGNDNPTTNNKMELTAAVSALSCALEKHGADNAVAIHTDSAYAMNSMTQWVHNWKKNGWRKSDGKTIENLEMIQTLYKLCYQSGMKVSWVKVKAHQKPGTKDYDRFNDFVDKLAASGLR